MRTVALLESRPGRLPKNRGPTH